MNQVSREETDKIIRQHMWSSMGVSLIPIPLIDFTAITVIQFNMIRKLSRQYGVPLIKKNTKSFRSLIVFLASLADDFALGVFRKTMLPAVSASLATSLTKAVPVAGQSIGVATAPVINGGFTYAIGKMMVRQFESGESFFTLNPEKEKEYYMEMFTEGTKIAIEMQKEKNQKTS
jgi:uncharacterized protein (DUF697 family)